MAMIEAQVNSAQNLADLKKVTGYYLGKRSEDIPGNETREARKVFIHYFANDSGIIEIWGFTQMDLKLRNVIPGMLTSLEYLGLEEKDGRSLHQVKIFYDPQAILNKEKLEKLTQVLLTY